MAFRRRKNKVRDIMDIENFRWKLTEDEKERRIINCPKCGSENLNPAGGWNSANGRVKCYDCGHGPFWWLKGRKVSEVD